MIEISTAEAAKMVLEAKWVSPRGMNDLVMEMKNGERFNVCWPEDRDIALKEPLTHWSDMAVL